MVNNGPNESSRLTEEAMLANQLARALSGEDIDETFRIIGRFMDKHRYHVSAEVFDEFKLAGRIHEH